MKAAVVDFVAEHPLLFVRLVLSRMEALWSFDYIMARNLTQYYDVRGAPAAALLAYEAGGFIAAVSAILAGLMVGFREVRYRWLLLAIGGLYAAPYLLAFSAPVYHIPIVALLSVFAGKLASREAIKRLMTNRWRLRLFLCLVLLLIAVQVHQILILRTYQMSS
jgi:hypothetical protein